MYAGSPDSVESRGGPVSEGDPQRVRHPQEVKLQLVIPGLEADQHLCRYRYCVATVLILCRY